MTSHSYHPRSHTHGLHPGCPRCEQLADDPETGLDAENRARILAGEIYTELDQRAEWRLRQLNRRRRQQDATHRSRR